MGIFGRLFLMVAVFFLMTGVCWGVKPTTDEMSAAKGFVSGRFDAAKPGNLPFSFIYDGKASADVLKNWKITLGSVKKEKGYTLRSVVCTDPVTKLEIRCVIKEFADYPAVDWVLYLTNRGSKDTPIIENIRPLDLKIKSKGSDGFVIHHSLGESNSAQSFAPVDDILTSAKPGPLVLAPNGGRSSDGHMPYFNVDWKTGGVAAAIGWSGQWEAGFEVGSAGDLHFRAGQQLTHLKLHPGESIRTPRILFVFWNGSDDLRGNNLFRRVMMAHYMPRRNGKLVLSPICASVNWVGENGDYEKPHLDVMKPYAERGVEVFWSDMDPQQWYPIGFPNGTGTWEPDPVKYPHGLKPVGDAAKANGLEYLLWFEPERVHPGSRIDRDHQDFVMTPKGEWSQLFRLHDKEARKWLTDYIDVQITEAQLSWVRWDFNIEPLGFWRRNDEPDRQGITEIRHIEGLYAMWEDLQKRHPGLIIDNCASGGRRIDIETCSRSVPLWHSDLQCSGAHPAADQLQNGGLFRWVPMHGCGNFAYEPTYAFRSAMTAGNILAAGDSKGVVTTAAPETVDEMKKTVAIYKKLRPFMFSDFYPLLAHLNDEASWYGYQFDNPSLKGGYAILFRREKSSDASKAIKLKGIDLKASYEVTFEDTLEKRVVKGSELAALKVEIPSAPGSAIVYYKRVQAE